MEKTSVPRLAYRLSEFGPVIGYSRSKGYQILREGRGPRVTIVDGQQRILLDDLCAWLREQQTQEVA